LAKTFFWGIGIEMNSPVISTTQMYNRRNLGYLWDKRAELDPGQVAIINSIYNNKKKGAVVASQTITYKLSNEIAGKLGYGRLYGSKGSFETLEKECRGTVCKEFYHDIDVVNCHPVLLVQFAKTNYDVELPEVEKYVNNREAYLKNVMVENSVTRDEAKQAIISVLYGGTVNQKSCLYDLCQEVRSFSKKLFQMPDYADLARAVKSRDNIYGSFLSFVLQTEERRCMLAMKTFMEKDGWSVDVLCYDGVMIRKRDGHVPDLRSCEKFVCEETNYKIDLVSKEFSSFDMPSVSEEIVKGVTLDAYLEMKNEFEKNHFYHSESDRFVEVRDDSTLLFMNLTHAHEYLNNKWYFKLSDKFGDVISFLDLWRKDPKRKQCYMTSFREGDDNTFTIPINFTYMQEKPFVKSEKALELFLELVSLNTNGKEEITNYFLDYFAHMLQKPTELPGVALIITGEKGVGKDTLGDFLQEWVVGKHLSTDYTSNKQFFEKHDMGKLNKILIKLQETSSKDCWENADALKAIITAYRLSGNPKGLKEIICENLARFIFTTNKANPVDLSDNERRYVLSACSNKRRGDFPFWKELRDVLFNYSGGRTIAEYLLARDISNFEVRKLPNNDFQKSVIQSEKTSEDRFIEQWEGLRTPAVDLYNEYKCFCIENSIRYTSNASAFGKKLQSFVRNGTINNIHPNNISSYEKP